MKKKIIRNSIIVVVSLVIVLFAFVYFTAKSSLPITNGSIKIDGLTEEVDVYRNEKGIPTINAKNDKDLYFAQGFIQAQDRLFQMDLARRQASGRLSEVIGKAALENDKKFLLFDLRRSAERSQAAYSKETIDILESFANGVNTFIKYAKDSGKLPYEFKLLGYEPENWSVVDSLTIGKYMAYDLGGHYDYQAFNNFLLNKFGEDTFKELNSDAVSKDLQDIDEIIEINKKHPIMVDEKLASLKRPPIDNGSNNWVLSGSKTESGKPLLADDPHLSLSTPSIWYQMHLISPSQNVSGVIFTGVPGIILGNNENIAWGVTNYGPDVQDLYIEKRNPNNLNQFELDGKYYDSKIVEHNIKVKGEEDVPFNLEYSVNGIVFDEIISTKSPNTSITMKWTAHDSTNELEAVLALNKASNWEQFEKGLENFKVPAQNFVFSDKDGNIALKSNGNIPIRKKGNAILPVPGYDSSYSWSGYIPYDKLPREVNPEKGYLATANVETDNNLDYHTSNIFAEPYRMDRIDEVLSQDKKFNLQDMKDLQMDVKNLAAVEFLDKFLENIDKNIIDESIYKSLKEWDKYDQKESLSALIFNKWLYKVDDNMFKSRLNDKEFEFMPYRANYAHSILRKVFNGENVNFIDDQGGIKKILTDSYREVISDIKKEQGQDISKWNWGKAHVLYLKHPLSGANSILESLLSSKKAEMSGSRYTVKASRENDKGYVNHGASWRFVHDMSTGIGEHIVAPGQSGHFMSENYQDQYDNWIDGNYTAMDVNNKKGELLKLLPN